MEYIGSIQRFLWRMSNDTVEFLVIFFCIIGVVVFSFKLIRNKSERKNIKYIVIFIVLGILTSVLFYFQFVQLRKFDEVDISEVIYGVRFEDGGEGYTLNNEEAKVIDEILREASYRVSYERKDGHYVTDDQIILELFSAEAYQDHIYITLSPTEIVSAYSPDYSKPLDISMDVNRLYNYLNKMK